MTLNQPKGTASERLREAIAEFEKHDADQDEFVLLCDAGREIIKITQELGAELQQSNQAIIKTLAHGLELISELQVTVAERDRENMIMYACILEASTDEKGAQGRCKLELQRIARRDAALLIQKEYL